MTSFTLVPILMMLLFMLTCYRSSFIYRMSKDGVMSKDNRINTYEFHHGYTKVDVNSINET